VYLASLNRLLQQKWKGVLGKARRWTASTSTRDFSKWRKYAIMERTSAGFCTRLQKHPNGRDKEALGRKTNQGALSGDSVMAFNYEADTDPDAVISVADDIRGSTALKPLSEEERALRALEQEFRVEENRRWHEQRRLEYQQERAAKAEAAQREEAIAVAREREKANARTSCCPSPQREIAALRLRATHQEAWQRNVDRAAANAVHQQRTLSLMGELDQMFSPPPPEPEPEIVYVEDSDRLGWGELPSWRDFRKLRQPWE
jgi:hypothetical protein